LDRIRSDAAVLSQCLDRRVIDEDDINPFARRHAPGQQTRGRECRSERVAGCALERRREGHQHLPHADGAEHVELIDAADIINAWGNQRECGRDSE
jgi:hypothetical protein